MVQRISFWVGVLVFGFGSVAHAEQFVLVDVSYTHSEDTTNDSHYYVTLPADTPKDWTKPVDWSKGSVHLILDVKTKPAGDAKTKLQVCFEGTPAYACTLQSPTYTKTGRVEWDSPFADFWYGGEVNWAQGVKKIPLILKDDANNKPAGDPKYMPTDLHVQVTLVSPGSKFVAPPAAGSGGAGGAAAGTGAGGTGAAGMPAAAGGGGGGAGEAARAGAGGATAAAGGGGTSAGAGGAAAASGGASAAGRSAAGSSATTAGSSAGAAGTGNAGATAGTLGTTESPQTTARPTSESEGGCQSAGKGAGGAWAFAALLMIDAWRRRRSLAAR